MTKLDDPKTTMMLQEMEEVLVPLGTPSSKHSRRYWLHKQSQRACIITDDVTLFQVSTFATDDSMHVYIYEPII